MTGEFGLKNPKTTKFRNSNFWVPRFIAPSHNAVSVGNNILKNLKKTQQQKNPRRTKLQFKMGLKNTLSKLFSDLRI